jgi:UDP-glucose 4-epimerase
MVEPLSDFEGNTALNYRILNDLRRRSPQTIYIHLSSAAVYGSPNALPINENATIAPISAYGWHRRLSEIVLEEYAALFGLRTGSLRIFSAFGAGLRRQVIWELAMKAHMAVPGPLMLQGYPDDSRDFIHGSDVAAAVATIAECGELTGECYNVAGGKEVCIMDLATLIMRSFGRERKLEFDYVRRSGNPRRWHADITKLRNLSFNPEITLEQGTAEVVEEVIRSGG